MVVLHHFTSNQVGAKLSQIAWANTFRPGQHTNFIRNPLPFNAPQPSNSTGQQQPAGASNGSNPGGAGGSKWSAGRNAHSWGFQARVVTQPGIADSATRYTDEDQSEDFSPSQRRPSLLPSRPSATSTSRLSSTTSTLPSSTSTSSTTTPSNHRLELLQLSEAGLSGVRVSSEEVQRRYKDAFKSGVKTPEVYQMEREADEIDFGIPSSVEESGGRRRRASVSKVVLITSSTSTSSLPTTSTGLGIASTSRGIHTSAVNSAPLPSSSSSSSTPSSSTSTSKRPSSSFLHDPPQATITPSRQRRHSTASILDVPSPSSSSTPPSPDFFANAIRNNKRPPLRERRPPSSSPSDTPNHKPHGYVTAPSWEQQPSSTLQRDPSSSSSSALNFNLVPSRNLSYQGHEFVDQAAEKRHKALSSSAYTKNEDQVLRAVRNYEAVETAWSTISHNAAMAALLSVMTPSSSDYVARITKLYNDLFTRDGLKADSLSYNTILQAFCLREVGVRENIELIQGRRKKIKLTNDARGPWFQNQAGVGVAQEDNVTFEALEKEDYLTPALKIYAALGKNSRWIDPIVVQNLMDVAADKGRVDVALSLFAKLDRRLPHTKFAQSYLTLLRMYTKVEKDPQAMREIFEAYLEARQAGMKETISLADTNQVYSPKHGHSSEVEYSGVGLDSKAKAVGDRKMWSFILQGMFEVGEPGIAIELMEKLMNAVKIAEEEKRPPPRGYPSRLTPSLVTGMVHGAIRSGDAEAARRWFDEEMRLFQDQSIHSSSFEISVSLAIDAARDDLNPDFIDLARHIFRSLLSHLDRKLVSQTQHITALFITLSDFNMAVAYSTPNPELRKDALDFLLESLTTFQSIVERGLIPSIGENDRSHPFGTGFIERIIQALSYDGRWDSALEWQRELELLVIRAREWYTPLDAEGNQLRGRKLHNWSLQIVKPTAALLGLTTSGHSAKWQFGAFPRVLPSPPIGIASTAMIACKRVIDAGKVSRRQDHEVALIESFLRDFAAVEYNSKSLSLSPDQWFTILDSAAIVASFERDVELPFTFPGFEAIVDAYCSAEGTLESTRDFVDYVPIVRALLSAGISKQRTVAILCTIDPRIDEAAAQGNFSLDDIRLVEEGDQPARTPTPPTFVPEPISAPTELNLDPAPSAEFEAIVATNPSDALDASELGYFPTPPSTPPTYLTSEVASSSSPPSVAQTLAISYQLTKRIEAALNQSSLVEAYQVAFAASEHGDMVHPDVLAKLVEGLGRDGKVDEARRVYLLAYDALQLLETSDEQSISWVTLEDKMIVALAHAGAMEDVVVHRQRLLEQGSAPSADAYAAMILNMHETTDDAAVALELFEESQRHNVAPTVFFFNTLISKLSRARRAREALTYFELMKKMDLRPTSITYGAVINACCKTGDDVSADYLFKEMIRAPGFKPRVPPYNTMIQFYTSTKPSRDRALDYFDQLVKARVQPTGHTYKLLLDAYGLIGEPDLPSVQDVFQKLLEDPGVTVTGAHWASLVQIYGERVGDLDKAVQIFDAIATHPSTVAAAKSNQPDAVVYESLLNVFVHHTRPELVEKYVKQMLDRGVRMTAYVANTIINGHITRGDLESARTIFESMADPGAGHAAAGNHIVDRHSKFHHGAHPAPPANVVFREPSTWEIMVKAELAAGNMRNAHDLVSRVEMRAFPDAVVQRFRKMLSDVGVETLPVSPSPTQ